MAASVVRQFVSKLYLTLPLTYRPTGSNTEICDGKFSSGQFRLKKFKLIYKASNENFIFYTVDLPEKVFNYFFYDNF